MFEKTITHLRQYREARTAALHNQAPARWFTSDVETFQELSDQVFDPKEEDDAWVVADAEKAATEKLVGLRTRINFILGCRHAIRDQFAVSEKSEPKNDIDFDRHAFQDIKAAGLFTDRLDRVTRIAIDGGKGAK